MAEEQKLFQVVNVAIRKLSEHPANERYKTPLSRDSEEYQLMRASMAEYGLRNPILVQEGTDIVISGHTRLRIARELGWTTIPVRYIAIDDEAAETMLIQDNIERAGAEPDLVKRARAVVRLYIEHEAAVNRGEAIHQVAKRFGIKQRQLDRLRNVLDLIEPLQDLVSQGKIGLKTVDVVAKLDESEQADLYQLIAQLAEDSRWTLTEERAKTYRDAIRSAKEDSQVEAAATTDSPVSSGILDDVEDEAPAFNAEKQHAETVERDVAVSGALQQLQRQQRALDRWEQQLSLLHDVSSYGGSDKVKSEIASLRKNIKAYLKSLDDLGL